SIGQPQYRRHRQQYDRGHTQRIVDALPRHPIGLDCKRGKQTSRQNVSARRQEDQADKARVLKKFIDPGTNSERANSDGDESKAKPAPRNDEKEERNNQVKLLFNRKGPGWRKPMRANAAHARHEEVL